jgi:ATP-dependent Clp protease ATP-binding subunit ClpC
VFERFTDRARRVVVLAQEEARMLNHSYIGTEHILLGLIHEGEGVAATALEALGISLSDVRADIQSIIGQGQSAPTSHIPFTPRAKKVLELSLREALQLGHNYIGTEHLLLGLVREGDGVGAQVLVKRGATLDRVRQGVLALVAASESEGRGVAEQVPEPVVHDQPRCPTCRAWLSETAAYRVLEVPAAAGGETRAVTFAFCRSCGTWLGTLA